MKKIFNIGDQKSYVFEVKESDVAIFDSGVVHPVCSTFALAREIEWSSRLFVLEMREADEEGIGVMLTIDHRSPAMEGQEVEIVATVASMENNELICDISAMVGKRVIATGKTGQKILKRQKIEELFRSVK